MFTRSTFIALIAASFTLAGPAFADGKGKGPTHTAPPLLPQHSQTIRPIQPAQPYNRAPVTTYTQAPVIQTPAEQGLVIDTSSFTGGVGVGVNDVFVGGGGGFFGSGFAGNSFGARSRGVFAGRNVALSRRVNGFRGRSSFRGGSRRGGGRR